MRNALITLLASLTLAAGIPAQAKPDFSGTWRLDLSRSDAAAHAETPGPVTLTIKQSPTEIHITTTTSRGWTDTTYAFVSDDAPPPAGRANARWRGDALLTNAVRDIRGQSVTVQQSRQLSADGKEMIVESIVNVQHGYTVSGAQTYGMSRDVFVKLP